MRESFAVDEFECLESSGSVVARAVDLIADGAAERAGQWVGGDAPIARVRTGRRGRGIGRYGRLIDAPIAGDLSDGVGELFGGQPAQFGPAEGVRALGPGAAAGTAGIW